MGKGKERGERKREKKVITMTGLHELHHLSKQKPKCQQQQLKVKWRISGVATWEICGGGKTQMDIQTIL